VSVHVISAVLRYSEARLGDRLVLIVRADKADNDGRNAYPSVATIAAEARMSVRQVTRSLKRLQDGGHIVSEGFSEYGTRRYRIVMDKLSGVTNPTRSAPDLSPEPSFDPVGSEENRDAGGSTTWPRFAVVRGGLAA
jgi:hypothetical protein